MIFYSTLALITSCADVFLRKMSLIFFMPITLNLVEDTLLLNKLLKIFPNDEENIYSAKTNLMPKLVPKCLPNVFKGKKHL